MVGARGAGEGGQGDQLLPGGPGLVGFTSTVPRFFSVQGDLGQVVPNAGWGRWQAGGVGKGRCLEWKLHCPSLGGPGGHPVLSALSRLSREPSLSLTPAPRSCRRPRAARRKQTTLSCPLPPPTVLSPQGGLTCLGEAAATWEISGSCGKQAGGERPLFSPPLLH